MTIVVGPWPAIDPVLADASADASERDASDVEGAEKLVSGGPGIEVTGGDGFGQRS